MGGRLGGGERERRTKLAGMGGGVGVGRENLDMRVE